MKWFSALALSFCLAFQPADARDVQLGFERTLGSDGTEIPYQLNLTLKEVSPTRISVDALLDLRDLQAALIQGLRNTELSDLCNADVTLDSLDLTALGRDVNVEGRVKMEAFRCDHQLGQPPKRQDSIAANTITFTATASVQVQNQCVYFDLAGLELTLETPILEADTKQGVLNDARSIIEKAADALLKRNPICPSLPPELSSIDPRYDAGGTVEIGDGGIGVALDGSFDVSPDTILSILKVLQEQGKLPPAP
ncbi:hypothetical protein RUESEDTHA_03346 [Ruegeria sp. THAF57]|uniref:hypothetical protein n=1 Tax=Ruegeria sp. THAF57 TaxID=2744555 RepID=UPI0015DE6CD4|nr:hypothetical protein [Ruegeria sp. THAF57]CAD0186438.1 hypothetical protein RUESEDTHA_03346 [Ruegeria sp. THAF57]